MHPRVKQATEHWQYVAPLLNAPEDEVQYDLLVEALDDLLGLVGDDEAHPLAGLMTRIGDLIESYDHEHRPMPVASGAEVLRFLIQEHGLKQSELPEVGTQSVVSEILAGKRKLNLRQIRWLSERFNVRAEVFF